MATSDLPQVGVQAVVEGVQTFVKDIDSVNKAIDNSTKTTTNATKSVAPFSKALDTAGVSVDNIRDKLSKFVKDSVPFGDQIGGFVDKLVALPLPALAAVAAVVALGAAFLALGNRGAPLQELGIAFDHITASIGLNSQQLLKDLRAASEGTVADFDLIKTANQALLGVSGSFGSQLGQALPQFLKIAKVEADATGRSVNELFNNLVEGVKKGTPKLIENTGLVIEQKAAYQDYAKTLGITVGQLSDTDRSMALLNATLAEGSKAIDALSGSAESNADKLARQQATITNIFDGLAIAVQPAFGVVLDATQKVLDIFQELALAVGPIFGGIVSIIANVFSTIIEIVLAVVQPIVDIISSIAPYFAIAFQTIANILGIVGKIIGDVVNGIVKFLKDVSKNFFGLDLDNLGPQLFNGAAAAFGSFANGIIAVANQLIFPAVIGIAQFIADFLIGFSPPKEGPLSVIDKGGENLMLAWLDGISGVSLDPVKDVAKQVSDALGSIGGASLAQVKTRLGQLDTALLPFQNRLAIIQAQFDALNAPAKAALDAIDRETAQLQDAAAQGNPAAVEKLRVLDAQRQTIQDQVDAQQALVDGAQIQLGLAQAQQAPERALLTIRQAQLDALAKAQGKTTAGGGGAKTPKEPKAPAGTAPVDTNAGGAGGISAPTTGAPSVLDTISGQDKVDAAQQGIQNAFTGAIDTKGLKDAGENVAKLSVQVARIGSVDIGAKIADKFKGLSDAFDPKVKGSVANVVDTFFNGDASTDGSLASFFAHVGDALSGIDIAGMIKDKLSGLINAFDPKVKGSIANIISDFFSGDAKNPKSLAGIFNSVTSALSGIDLGALLGDKLKALSNPFDPSVEGSIANLATVFFSGDIKNPKSLAGIFNSITTSLSGVGDTIKTTVQNLFNGIFDPTSKDSPASIIADLTGDSKNPKSVAFFFSTLPDKIVEAANGLFDTVRDGVFKPFTDFLTANGEGGLADIIDQALDLFRKFPASVVDALKGFAASVQAALVTPVIHAINSLIGLVETGLRGFINKMADFVQSIANALGDQTPDFIKNAIGSLHAAAGSINFPRIPEGNPAIGPPRAAAGGIFSSGLLTVGEKGTETLFNASKVGVIPHELTNVLMSLQSILAQPSPMPVYAGGNTSNMTTNSSSFNFNGVQSDNDARRRYNYLRASMR